MLRKKFDETETAIERVVTHWLSRMVDREESVSAAAELPMSTRCSSLHFYHQIKANTKTVKSNRANGSESYAVRRAMDAWRAGI